MITCRTKSADDTRELASVVAGTVRPGDVLLLAGDLGAGKTTFTQGLARGLGVEGPVTSPTFTLMHEYEGRGGLPILHVDVYRLETLQEIVDLAIPELVDDAGVAIVEWGDVAEPVLPKEFLEVRLSYADADAADGDGDGDRDGDAGDDGRHVELRPVGTGWVARAPVLRAGLGRWVLPA